jgi:hypothetical protein
MLAIPSIMAVQPYFDRRETTHEPIPLTDAAESTFFAAERLMKDWLALARLQAVETVKSGATAAALFGAATFLALLAWVGASVAGGFLLARWLPADASAAIVAAANAVIAGALVARALHRGSKREEA